MSQCTDPTRIEQALVHVARQQGRGWKGRLGWESKSLADLSRCELTQELATVLEVPVGQLESVLTDALASPNLTDQATALLARGCFGEAESKSLEAARQRAACGVGDPEAEALDYNRAGTACHYRCEYHTALGHYKSALTLVTRGEFPLTWAKLQNNLGLACIMTGLRIEPQDRNRWLGKAVQAYRAALEVYTRDTLPQDWAMTQEHLAIALGHQGHGKEGEEDIRLLEEAVQAYRTVMEVRTREALPQEWGRTQIQVGNLLCSLADRQEGPEGTQLLADAVQAYRAALEVHPRAALPREWASVQNLLGCALEHWGDRDTGAAQQEHWNEADTAHQAALEVWTGPELAYHHFITAENLERVRRKLNA